MNKEQIINNQIEVNKLGVNFKTLNENKVRLEKNLNFLDEKIVDLENLLLDILNDSDRFKEEDLKRFTEYINLTIDLFEETQLNQVGIIDEINRIISIEKSELDKDYDGDGISNFEEINDGTDPLNKEDNRDKKVANEKSNGKRDYKKEIDEHETNIREIKR